MSRAAAHRGLTGRFAPFAGAAVLTWVAVPIGSHLDVSQYLASLALLVMAITLGIATLPDGDRDRIGLVESAVVFLLAAGLLRNAAGGISSAAGGISLIPVLYVALYSRSRRDLVIVLAGVAIFYLAPILLVGPPAYPQSQYRAALLSVTVSAVIGLTTQRLVADVRFQAGQARDRGVMLEQVSHAIHLLFVSDQARTDTCLQVHAISKASVVVLYEPDPLTGALHCTGSAGNGQPPLGIRAGDRSAVAEVFAGGRARLVTDKVEDHLGSVEVWRAAGSPPSVLLQPLLTDDAVLGVLVVAWPGDVEPDSPQVTVAELLSDKAAAVIDRADRIEHLTGEAQSDALTGLPNRRAWDAALARAASADQPIAVAILDLDRFKEFNDTYGHPAGDRLLKETAAAWRDELRAGDFLARLGGEEFGAILAAATFDGAMDAVERLRHQVPQGRTCSAGIAIRKPGESAESVIVRADAALYQAKSEGRDCTRVSAGQPVRRVIGSDPGFRRRAGSESARP